MVEGAPFGARQRNRPRIRAPVLGEEDNRDMAGRLHQCLETREMKVGCVVCLLYLGFATGSLDFVADGTFQVVSNLPCWLASSPTHFFYVG